MLQLDSRRTAMKKLIYTCLLTISLLGFSVIVNADDPFVPMKPGTSYSTYGNTTYGSDGTTCSTYGNSSYCD